MIYGQDNRDKLPVIQGGLWAWDLPYSVADVLLQNNITRDVMYDPGFPEMNQDGLWNYAPTATPSPFRVIGYAMTFPGTSSITASNQNASLLPGSLQVGTNSFPAPDPRSITVSPTRTNRVGSPQP